MNAAIREHTSVSAGSLLKRWALTALFIGFLFPVSIGGVSVNYSFAVLPLCAVLVQGRMQRPGHLLAMAMGAFLAIFLVALLYQADYVGDAGRRLASFVVFMTMFAFTFVRADEEMVAAFKDAVVLISLAFSIKSMVLLMMAGGSVGFEAKDLVGSQRYGFIYVLALWIVFLDPRYRRIWAPLRFGVLAVIAGGLLLTFSRSSIVAALGSLMLYVLTEVRLRSRVRLSSIVKVIASMVGAGLLVLLLYSIFPLAFDFFGERLFAFLSNSDAVRGNLVDARTSEGTRLFIAQQILDFVSRNPLTGSGYLGVWMLPHVGAGSAHNQYLDVLFRTGVVGLIAYGVILLSLLRFLALRHRALFWGIVGVLIYGLFHETFKESQGGFVLAFLVGAMAHEWRIRRNRQNSPQNPRKVAMLALPQEART